MMVRKLSIFLSVAMTITLAACNPKPKDHTIVKKGDKTITIIEPEGAASSEELKVEKIEEYKDLRAIDWQDEDKLLVSKKNTNVDKIQSEGELFYPNNFYIFDKNTGEYKVISEESANQLFGEFSPNKRHIFYKNNIEETASGYVVNFQGQNKVSITGDNTMRVTNGRWVDNERVIYHDFSNSVFEADISGKIVELANLSPESVNDVYRDGDDLYYITVDLKFKKYNLISKEKSILDENVYQIFPSKDYNRIAYVKADGNEKRKLIVSGKNFSKQTLEEGISIYRVSWSPDNSRLVFSIIKEDANETGIYLSDMKAGKATRIALFEDVFSFSWSPSGKKIAVCRLDNDNEFWTNIITLSK